MRQKRGPTRAQVSVTEACTSGRVKPRLEGPGSGAIAP
jgi:hypothetical protein